MTDLRHKMGTVLRLIKQCVSGSGVESLLKQISVSELRVDMYIHEIVPEEGVRLPKRKSGKVSHPQIIDKFHQIGVRYLIIDIEKGIDAVPLALAPDEPMPKGDDAIENALTFFDEEVSEDHRALSFEWFTAKEIFSVTTGILSDTYESLRSGGKINVGHFQKAASAIARSLRRNKDALIWFGKLRHLDSYAYEHCVNCAVLMGVACISRNASHQETEEAVLGALLQNVGESQLPESLVTKTGKLTPEEMDQMKAHVNLGVDLLSKEAKLPERVKKIVAQHHERMDGSGYPNHLQGIDIDPYARLAAIVDSYDALSTRKVYREAIPPSQAMRIVLQDSKTQYDEQLVHQFIKCMGVYPTGTLVKLNSDMLAVVMEQNQESRLEPDVKVIYNLKTAAYIQPHMLKLSSEMVKEKIVGYEDPRAHKINVTDFMPNDEDFR